MNGKIASVIISAKNTNETVKLGKMNVLSVVIIVTSAAIIAFEGGASLS